jgi:adenosine deaminase
VLVEEYEIARAEMGLDDDALAAIARASIDGSGAPDELKASTRRAIDGWITGGTVRAS